MAICVSLNHGGLLISLMEVEVKLMQFFILKIHMLKGIFDDVVAILLDHVNGHAIIVFQFNYGKSKNFQSGLNKKKSVHHVASNFDG